MLKEILTARTRPSDKALYNIWARKISDGWTETTITGSLPLTFRAKGDTLTDYTVHGTAAGAGARTENLWDGTYNNCYFDYNNGKFYSPDNTTASAIVACSPNTTYTIRKVEAIGNRFRIGCFNSYPTNGDTGQTLYVSESGTDTLATVTTSNDASYLVIFVDYRYSGGVGGQLNVVSGSTAPSTYIPYGYKIPLTNTSGVTENKANPDDVEIITLNGKYGVKITGAGTWQVKAFDNVYTYVQARVYNSNNEWLDFATVIVGSTGTMYSKALTLNDGDTLCIFDPLAGGTEQIAKDKIKEDKIVAIKSDTAPDHYIPHRYTADYNLYIGDSKLGEEEYVDYAEGKVYKRNPQSYFWINQFTKYDNEGRVQRFITWNEEDRDFIISHTCGYVSLRGEEQEITRDTEGVTVYDCSQQIEQMPQISFFATRFKDQGQGANIRTYILIDGEYVYGPSLHVTYEAVISAPNETINVPRPSVVLPTDPPTPLPAITAYQGENTLSSTETVGSVSVTGKIKEVTP